MGKRQRAILVVLTSLVLVCGWVPDGALQAAELFIDGVLPAETSAGELFTVHGSFSGVTAASLFVSDGMVGRPLEVVSIADSEIVGRAAPMPWPMVGAVHVLVHDGLKTYPDQLLQWDGQQVELLDGALWTSGRTVSGGTLALPGQEDDPPKVFGVFAGDLLLDPIGPCADGGGTALVLIEPDLGAPSGGLQGSTGGPCTGSTAQLSFLWPNSANMTLEAFYTAVAAGFNQIFGGDGLSMSFEPNGGSGGGTLTITQVGCPIVTGSAVILCL